MPKIRKTYSVDVDDAGICGTSFRQVSEDRLLLSCSVTTGDYREVYSLWMTRVQAQRLLVELRRVLGYSEGE